MVYRLTVLLLLFSAWYSFSALANTETSILRDKFEQADKLVWRSTSEEYQRLYNELHFYPLQPYLDQKRLMYRIKLSDHNEIAKFLNTYENTPLDWPLRKKWLEYLAKRNKKSLFVSFYRPTADAELTCTNYRYQLDLGADEKDVLPQVTDLWVIGKSQPKVCDPLFERWQKAGFRTNEVVWQRLVKAADGGKHTLIPYLTSLLPEQQRYLGELWHKVRRDPSYVTKLSRFPYKSDKEAQIYLYGIKRFIWRDQNRALASFDKAKKAFAFDDKQVQSVAPKFALALASKKHDKASVWLKMVDDQHLNDQLIQWRIADVLRLQNWPEIKAELLSLPSSEQDSLQWRYWYARSLIETGEIEQGESLLTQLAKSRHYYGFLAASVINQPVSLQNKPISVAESEKRALFQHLAGKRAFELFHLQRFYHARLEWNYWMTQLNERERLVAAKLANEVGWYDRAIFGLSQVGYLDDVDLRFPLAFNDEIVLNSSKHAISPAWAFAIARRESSFMSDAHSSAGAKGLMQVMPATAKQLTRRKRISNQYLLDSENNINLGTKYLRKLLDRHQGNPVLATAAYNAGPYRVKRWLASADSLPADIWIETIPFKETRDYVKSVMAYQQIYQYKVGQTVQIFDQLTKMNISQL